MTIGKDYRKVQQTIRGAALFYLALERNGGKKIGGANEIIRSAFGDLGVTEDDVLAYIEAHREELSEELKKKAPEKRIP